MKSLKVIIVGIVLNLNLMSYTKLSDDSLGSSIAVGDCASLVKQSADMLQALYKRIQSEKDMAKKLVSRGDSGVQEHHRARVEFLIKHELEAIRGILNKVEKTAQVATIQK